MLQIIEPHLTLHHFLCAAWNASKAQVGTVTQEIASLHRGRKKQLMYKKVMSVKQNDQPQKNKDFKNDVMLRMILF